MSYFTPSVARAKHCRTEMDAALWSSVEGVLAGLDNSTVARTDAKPSSLSARPTNLLDYGAYFDLVLTPPFQAQVSDSAKAAAAAHLASRLKEIGSIADSAAGLPMISNLSADAFSAAELERLRRWWDIEPANKMAMTPASDAEMDRARALIPIAFSHLQQASAELCEEVQIVVRDIVLSRPGDYSLFNYGGASSFALWGALTLNIENHIEWIQFYRQIVHEAGHNLLFGIARDEPLVVEGESSRISSPIRGDPRPSDGVFHAVFVSAREALAIDLLLCRHEADPCLEEHEVTILEDLLKFSILAFWDGLEVLRGQAELTQLGEQVLKDCESYMLANFAVEAC